MLVMTGVTSVSDAVLAAPGRQPTYISADLGGLLERQPAIGPGGPADTVHEGSTGRAGADADDAATESAAHLPGPDGAARRAFGCGGWLAQWPCGSGPLALTGEGAWIDGLRALCAAAWTAEHITDDMVAPALAALGDRH
jgi:hypothetical protein